MPVPPSSPSALQLLLLDTRSPSGGHNHSMGMESAISIGMVRDQDDVEAFCRGRLSTAGRVNASFASCGHDLFSAGAGPRQWARLDEEFDARTPSEAIRNASRQLALGLRRLTRVMLAGFDVPAQHHCALLGAAVASAGGDRMLASRAAMLSTVIIPASAALRLLGLDPFAIQAMLASLALDIDAAPAPPRGIGGIAADAAPALDLLADHHLTMEVRLFAS
jgi:urease accessory protein